MVIGGEAMAISLERSMELMERAVFLSLLGLGKTAPNPIVGAVITNEHGEIVAEGFHQGGPHAEIVALSNFSGQASTATLFITLEPCNHHGKTGPCSEAIIASGIKRVVYAENDPNPIAQGGAARLRDAGIEVTQLSLSSVAYANRDWLTKIELQRPRILWKVAVSLDGAVAAMDGSSQWITNPSSRDDVKAVRDSVDAIITGTGTVIADNPTLLGASRTPLRVIVGERELGENFEIFKAKGETIQIKSRDLTEVLHLLDQRGCNRVLVEAGPTLGTAFFNAGLVDEILFYQAPTILGSSRRFTQGLDLTSITEQKKLLDRGIEIFDGDIKRTLFADNEINRRLTCSPV